MKGFKTIAAAAATNLRFFNSPLTIRVIATRTLDFARNQVSQFFYPYTPPPFLGHFHNVPFPITHQKLYFSSKPNSIVELVLTNDWSQGLEHELEKCGPSLTHETVIYILKQLETNPVKASLFFNWVSKKEWFRASSSMFNLILRILANKETIKQFWITLGMMKGKGFWLDRMTYRSISEVFRRAKMNKDYAWLNAFFKRMLRENARQSVVNKVVGIISGSEWGDEVINELAKLKIRLSDSFVTRVLKELQIYPLKAYKFFHWVGNQSGYQQNIVTYNAIARVVARPGWIKEFWSIIDEMKSVGHELDIDTYIKISRQLEKNQMMEDAVKLYELMMDGPYKPSTQDCSILLNSIAASDSPNLDLVFRVAKKYESAGHALTKEIYDGIHMSLSNAGKFDEAENIVKTMRDAGYEPDNITYSQAVFGLCKMKRFEEAFKVLEEMESCGCIPDSNIWSILIQGYCAANEVDKALLYLCKMIKKGCNADAAAVGAVVDSFLNEKKIEDAHKLLMEMVSDRRASPSQRTYEKLIESLLGIEKFEEALDLFRLTRKHKCPPFNKPMLFVQYVSKFGTVEDAVKYLKAWRKGSPRSHSAYLHVFESLYEEGRVSEAKDLLCKCPSRIRNRKKIREFFASVEENCMAASRVSEAKDLISIS